MTKKIWMFVAAGLMLAMAACTPVKEQAITKLEKMATETKVQSKDYTAQDWVNFLNEYNTVDSLLNTVELTPEEKELVKDLKAKCAGYVLKGKAAKVKLQLKDAVEGVSDAVENALDGASEAVDGVLDALKGKKSGE